ncbi:MAG: PGF-pre-PGF domain-containing protein [Archaeoglobaceae archaeon]
MWKIWFTIILSLLLVATSSASDFVCTIGDSQKQFAGINVTEICFWDFYNESVAEFKFYGANSVQFPIGNLERLLIPGSKAHYIVQTTSITNTTLTSFPDTSIIYDKDSELNVNIRLKSNAEGLPIVLKFEDEKIEDWLNALQDNFGNFLQTITFEKIFNMSDYGYAFNANGWAKVRWNDSSKRVEVVSKKAGFNLGSNIIETIRINSIQLSDFRINNSSITSGLPEELKTMSPGYYALLVISVNEFGNPTFKLIVPFVVLNGTAQNNKPSFSSTVTKGEKLVLNFNRDFGFAFALLLKNVSYDSSIKVDLTKKITESLKANLTYSGKELEEIKLFDKNLGIFAPKEMFSYSYGSGSNTLELETSALETGEYILYVISFEEDSVIPMFVGSLKVQVAPPTTPTPTPTPTIPPTTTPVTTPRPIGGGGGGGGGAIPGVPIYISPYIAVMAKERYEITMPSATQKDTNVLSIVVIPEENVNVRVRVEKLEKLPPGIPLPEGIVALILSVELTLSKETGVKGEINFVLKRDEIRNLGFDPDAVLVALLRFDEKQMRWIKLDTKLTGKDENYNYYRAEVPGFSYFAVILESPKPTPTPTPKLTPTPTPAPMEPVATPIPLGKVGMIAAIIAISVVIAVVAYLLIREKK